MLLLIMLMNLRWLLWSIALSVLNNISNAGKLADVVPVLANNADVFNASGRWEHCRKHYYFAVDFFCQYCNDYFSLDYHNFPLLMPLFPELRGSMGAAQ